MRRSKSSSLLVISIAALVFALFPAQAQSTPTDGAALFKAKCAMCHGPDGAGNTPMGKKLNVRDLRSAEVQKQPDADLMFLLLQCAPEVPADLKARNNAEGEASPPHGGARAANSLRKLLRRGSLA